MHLDAGLQHDPRDELLATAAALAVPIERVVVERSLSINTAAAGGNASLMTLD